MSWLESIRNAFGTAGVDTSNINYTFKQQTSSKTWQITHGLKNQYPQVTVVDTNGDQVMGRITFTTVNELKIDFEVPIAGTAFVSI